MPPAARFPDAPSRRVRKIALLMIDLQYEAVEAPADRVGAGGLAGVFGPTQPARADGGVQHRRLVSADMSLDAAPTSSSRARSMAGNV